MAFKTPSLSGLDDTSRLNVIVSSRSLPKRHRTLLNFSGRYFCVLSTLFRTLPNLTEPRRTLPNLSEPFPIFPNVVGPLPMTALFSIKKRKRCQPRTNLTQSTESDRIVPNLAEPYQTLTNVTGPYRMLSNAEGRWTHPLVRPELG